MEHNYVTIQCKDSYDGRVVATLIETTKKNSDRAILYVHGFADYFLQDHAAKMFNDSQIDFYALELRRYGRSHLTHQKYFHMTSIDEYFEEISIVIEMLHAKGYKTIYLMGHSTGGLTTASYMVRGKHRDMISALVLNSPFLDINMPDSMRWFIPITKYLAKIFPYGSMKGDASGRLYNDSLHVNYKGDWRFFRSVREANVTYFAFINAVAQAHKPLHKGVDIKVPVLVIHSDKSFTPKVWSEEVHYADIILNHEAIKKYGKMLGKNVTLMENKDGKHDAFLSKSPEEIINKTINWINISHK
jgi:alpha-beta hydrolase superfamily lysophospholipase